MSVCDGTEGRAPARTGRDIVESWSRSASDVLRGLVLESIVSSGGGTAAAESTSSGCRLDDSAVLRRRPGIETRLFELLRRSGIEAEEGLRAPEERAGIWEERLRSAMTRSV